MPLERDNDTERLARIEAMVARYRIEIDDTHRDPTQFGAPAAARTRATTPSRLATGQLHEGGRRPALRRRAS